MSDERYSWYIWYPLDRKIGGPYSKPEFIGEQIKPRPWQESNLSSPTTNQSLY